MKLLHILFFQLETYHFLVLLVRNVKTTICKKRNTILVLGSINADKYYSMKRLPTSGENILLPSIKTEELFLGGKGCNQAISIAKLLSNPNKKLEDKLRVSFIGRVGKDSIGKDLYDKMKKFNKSLDLSQCQFTKYLTGQGLVFQEKSTGAVSAIVIGGSNIHGWCKGKLLKPRFLTQNHICTLVLQREIPDWVNQEIIHLVKSCNNPHCIVIQDVGGIEDPPLSIDYLKQIDYLIPNESELKRLTLSYFPKYLSNEAESEVEQAKKQVLLLKNYTKIKNIIVTLGSKGCLLCLGPSNKIYFIPACQNLPNPIIDETGAGDSFRGAFALRLTEQTLLSESLEVEEKDEIVLNCCKEANIAGAFAVMKQGAVNSLPTEDDILWLSSLQQEDASIETEISVLEEEYILEHAENSTASAAIDTRGGSGFVNKNDSFPFLIGSRINSMKDRKDLYPYNCSNIQDYIERQSTIKGLTCIDFNYPQHFQEENVTAAQLKELLDKCNLKAGAVCLRYPHDKFQQGSFTHYNETIRREAIELTKEAARAAVALSCSEVVIWSAYDGYDYPLQVNYEDKWNQIKTAFQELCDQFPSIKFSLEYKPTDENTRFFIVPSTGATLCLINEINRTNMGMTLDFGHCIMAGENPAQSIAFALQSKKLFGIQLNDGYTRLSAEDGLMFGSVHRYMALECIYYLLVGNYTGHVYFDTFPQRTDPVKEAEYNILQIKLFWKAALRLQFLMNGNSSSCCCVLGDCRDSHNAIGALNIMEEALDWAKQK